MQGLRFGYNLTKTPRKSISVQVATNSESKRRWRILPTWSWIASAAEIAPGVGWKQSLGACTYSAQLIDLMPL